MKTKEFIVKNIKWIVLFLCLIAFLAILEDILGKEIVKIDEIGYKLISTHLIKDTITPIAKIITQLGSAIFLIILSIIILILNKKIGLLVWINLFSSTILNQILKYVIQRPRPTEFRLIDEIGYSFPSGHSMVSAAFYGFLIYLIYKKVKNNSLKILLIISLSITIFLIGISRIYLGVHYTSDVISGFLISITYLIMFTSILKSIYNSTKK